MSNLTLEYIKMVHRTLKWYDGLCVDLADEVVRKFGRERAMPMVVWPPGDKLLQYWSDGRLICAWCYHAVPVIDDCVHDAWFPKLVLSPDEYIKAAFPDQDPIWKIVDNDSKWHRWI